jgi:hypothetical protein
MLLVFRQFSLQNEEEWRVRQAKSVLALGLMVLINESLELDMEILVQRQNINVYKMYLRTLV